MSIGEILFIGFALIVVVMILVSWVVDNKPRGADVALFFLTLVFICVFLGMTLTALEVIFR